MKVTAHHAKIFFTLLLGLLALLYLTDFGWGVLTPDLDSSWIAVITWAAHKPLQWGRDIVFTNGPLGYVLYPMNVPIMFWPALLIRLSINILLLVMLYVLSQDLGPVRRTAFIVLTLLATFYNAQTTYVFMVVVAAWLIFVREPPNRILQIACLTFLAMAAMMKGTHLSLVLSVMILGLAYWIWQRKWAIAATNISLFIFIFLIAWTATGQKISSILPYVRSTVEVVRGFGPSMASIPSTGILVAGLIGVVAGTTQIAMALARHRREPRGWFMSLILLLTLFLVWKMSFTRADVHTIQLFFYGVPAVLALSVFFHWRPSGISGMADYALIAIMFTCGLYVVGNQLGLTPGAVCRHAWFRLQKTVAEVFAPQEALANFEAAYQSNAQKLALPEIKKAVGESTVDVFGCEQAVAIANSLNYTPRPVCQGYVAATRPLIKANADFYRSPRAPDYVIFKLQTIDEHLPAMDDAEALLVLGQDYKPLLVENGYVLLQRKPNAPATTELKPISSGEIALGDSIPVPTGTIWCRLHIQESPLAKLLGFFYQPQLNFFEIEEVNGQTSVKRIILEAAAYGFLLNPLLRASDSTDSATQSSQVKSVRPIPPENSNWLMNRRVSYEFFEVMAR